MPAPNAPGRDPRGRFAPGHALSRATQFSLGNLDAATHLLRTDRVPPELEHLRAEVDAFLAGALADEGDAADVPTRRAALLEYRARLHRRIVQLDAALELRGLLDRRGKLRVGWLGQLAALVERARSLDVTLGLERRAKRVPSLAEVLQQHAEAAE